MKKWTGRLLELITAFQMFVMIGAVIVGVIFRYVFNRPLVSSYEFVSVMMVYVTFWGLTIAAFDNAHLGVDLISNVLSSRTLQFLNLAKNIITFLMCCVMVYYGYILTIATGKQLTVLLISAKWLYVAFPTGFAFFACYLLMTIWKNIREIIQSQGSQQQEMEVKSE